MNQNKMKAPKIVHDEKQKIIRTEDRKQYLKYLISIPSKVMEITKVCVTKRLTGPFSEKVSNHAGDKNLAIDATGSYNSGGPRLEFESKKE